MRPLIRPAVLVLVIAALTRVDGAIGIAAALGALGAVAWFYPRRSLRLIEVQRDHPRRVFHGESVEIAYTIANRAGLPVPWVSISDPVPFDLGIDTTRWVSTLDPGGRRTMTRTIEARRRGVYALGPATVAVGDLFGIRRADRNALAATRLIVYPQIVPLSRLGIASASPLPEFPTRVPLYADPTRLIGVKPYAPGDRFRDIHWKASASQGELLTKQFQPGIDRDVVVAIDLSLEAHPYPGRRRSIELAVTAAASIVHHMITDLGQSVGLRLVAVDAPTGTEVRNVMLPHPDHGHLMEVLEVLARARATRNSDPEFLIDQAGLSYGTSLVFVAGLLDRTRSSALLRARRRGPAVTAVITGRGTPPELSDLLAGSGVSVAGVASRVDFVQI